MVGIAARWLPLVAGTGLALIVASGCGQDVPTPVDTGPGGTAAVLVNPDGTGTATYRPARQADQVQEVDFWLRRPGGGWVRGGRASDDQGGVFAVARLDGTQQAGWSDTGAALSVHVLLMDGTTLVDPVPWVWSDEFQPPPSASPTALAATTDPALARSTLPRGPTPAPARTEDPFPAATAAGATAVCTDGTWSFAHGGDVCTSHGAVLWWTGRFGPAGPGGVGDRR